MVSTSFLDRLSTACISAHISDIHKVLVFGLSVFCLPMKGSATSSLSKTGCEKNTSDSQIGFVEWASATWTRQRVNPLRWPSSPLVENSRLFCSHPPQAVIQNPFSNGGSPAGETVGAETRFAYFPATAVSDGTVSVQAASDPQLTQAGGESQL